MDKFVVRLNRKKDNSSKEQTATTNDSLQVEITENQESSKECNEKSLAESREFCVQNYSIII